MKKLFLFTMMVLLMLSGVAQATLTTIGTATFVGSEDSYNYNLIWDDDNNGKSLVWLDFTMERMIWEWQMSVASSVDTLFSVTWNAGVSVTWTDPSWRLPKTVDGVYKRGYEGPDENGNYDYTGGYNLSNSELGHLYYEELENLAYQDTGGNFYQPGWGLQNTGVFKNLWSVWYWSSTEYGEDSSEAWNFNMTTGYQKNDVKEYGGYGLFVRSGEVSLVPVPGAIILLSAGLLWVVGIGRKSRRDI